MKTRLFISKLRAVTEVAAQLVFALLLLLLLISGYRATEGLLFRFWPIVVSVFMAYTVLSLTEDYLNRRIFYNYLQFT